MGLIFQLGLGLLGYFMYQYGDTAADFDLARVINFQKTYDPPPSVSPHLLTSWRSSSSGR